MPGSQWTFEAAKLQSLYGTVANYQYAAGQALQRQMEQGFLLPVDAEVLRRETIEPVRF